MEMRQGVFDEPNEKVLCVGQDLYRRRTQCVPAFTIRNGPNAGTYFIRGCEICHANVEYEYSSYDDKKHRSCPSWRKSDKCGSRRRVRIKGARCAAVQTQYL
ncbi:hypothetical protein KM043_016368 [Ampulex compressa]|nr:hypothetical protein KM043_016368 [Ampulex compressa]